MKAELQIADSLALPLDAVTQTIAFLARKGAGKTYGATKLAELMLDAGAQVIALDPVGNWYGLRLGANGKPPGCPIYVFGGEHGDTPLYPESGKQMAALAVHKRIPMILDVSSFRKGERVRFAMEFAEEFFHLKKTQRSPVNLMIEEAQKFIPQMPGPDEKRLLGAFEDIVRLGRNYGIGATLISQRPQSVNKEVLSQVECLFALQINGIHERKAIEAWVSEHGLDRQLIGELPSLGIGEAFCWSPSWLRIFKKIRIAKKRTFDASSTPEVGGKLVKAAELSPMDLDAIRADMEELVERAKAEDPGELRKRIGDLEAKLQQTAATSAADPEQLRQAHASGYQEGFRDLTARAAVLFEDLTQVNQEIQDAVTRMNNRLVLALANIKESLKTEMSPAQAKLYIPDIPAKSAEKSPGTQRKPLEKPQMPAGDLKLRTGEIEILTVAIQYPSGATTEQIAVLTEYKSTSRYEYTRSLAQKGLVTNVQGLVVATPAGRAAIPNVRSLPRGRELQKYWMERLPEGERKIFEIVVRNYPRAVHKADIQQETGYKSTSTYEYARKLAARKLVKLDKGSVTASELLF